MNYKIYVWQKPDWPSFRWDEEKVSPLLYETTRMESYFLGRISMIDPEIRNSILTRNLENEILSSNSIENITLQRDSVRSSILSRLGFDSEGHEKADRYTDGAVNIVIDAARNHKMPLTAERLFGWHAELFPAGMSEGRRTLVGQWRQGEMFVVSGRLGKEVIHYEAPPADRLEHEMEAFLEFINSKDMNPLLKAAIAHFWFVTIHPFSDGNGRIGRAIAEMLLARADNTSHRYYSLSSAIMADRKAYYEILEYCQKGTMDITGFLEYFLLTLQNAIRAAEGEIKKAIQKTQFWDSLRGISLNPREIKIINMLQDGFKGKLTTAKWAKLGKCSHSTALRDINDLISKGMLIADGGNSRNAGYILRNEKQEEYQG